MRTGFYSSERCFWHGGGNYAFTTPVGGYVQPLTSGGLPESPETKRRLKNLIDVSGLAASLSMCEAGPAGREDLERVHPRTYLDRFEAASAGDGGDLGLRAPFGPGGYEIAALSAGQALGALRGVLSGTHRNAYALTRPPGHHALPDWPNGFCLLANIAIAVRAIQAEGLADRIAILDWDVHHGNGTEAIFYDDPAVLTISLHQERNWPLDTGAAADRGRDAGEGSNVNVPLPAGTGHRGYIQAVERIALPVLRAHRPDMVVVACGFDAALVDPLGRMLATAETFAEMTRMVMEAAAELCGGRLALIHEGGYSEVYVPFCGHAAIATLAAAPRIADPFAETFAARQPGPDFDAFVSGRIADIAERIGLGARP